MKVLSTHFDIESRFLRVELKINEVFLNLINIYVYQVRTCFKLQIGKTLPYFQKNAHDIYGLN